MKIDAIELSDTERDALAEIANMGVSRAATSLRQMVGEQVLLSVPAVNIVTRQAASELVERGGSSKLVAVQQSFDGPFSGRALLIFPQTQSLELVRAIVGEEHSLEDVIDLEQEALAETGNIILNACLATIANVLHRTMRMSLPAVIRGDGATLFDVQSSPVTDNLVLFLYIDFTIKNRDVHGFIALLMDLPAITALQKIVGDYIDGIDDKLLTMLDNVSQPEFGSVIDVLDVRNHCARWAKMGLSAGTSGSLGSLDMRQSVLGKNLYELFPNCSRPGCRPLSSALEVGSSSVLTHSLNKLLPLCGEDGHELLHNIIVRPVSSGRSRSCLLQINDVTVAVTRERVLRERQNARYHAIVDSAPDAIITTNLDCTIQWVNGASQHVFGYAAPELLGQKIDLLLVPDGETARAFGEDATRRSDGADPLLIVGRRKDGRLANFEVSFGRWGADDHLFVTSIWRDVTERMLAEAAIRESKVVIALCRKHQGLVWTCDAKASAIG
jgi:chemotaxis protein CheC